VLIGAINPRYVQVVAIADIRPFNHHRAFHGDISSPEARAARPGLIAKYRWANEEEAKQNVKVFGDYKELLDFYEGKEGDEGIEAVIIALPLHLHAPASVAAMKQGYHVLTEALMARTIAECKEMARTAEQNKKHCATGHQRHYSVLYDHIVQMLQGGVRSVMGDLHYVRSQWHRNCRPGADGWSAPLPLKIKPEDSKPLEKVLAELEAELAKPGLAAAVRGQLQNQINQTKVQIADEILATGGEYNGFTYKSAKEYGYVDATIGGAYQRPAAEELIRWRLSDRTGAGMMAELGSHQLDVACMFLAATPEGTRIPLSVSATAARTIFPKDLDETPVDRDIEDHIHCVIDYPTVGYDPKDELGKLRKITVAFSSITGNDFDSWGETVYGTKGTVQLEQEKDAMLYERSSVHKTSRINASGTGEGRVLSIAVARDGDPPLTDPLSAAIGFQAMSGAGLGYCEQIEHWAYCIRENPEADPSKAKPRCYPQVALANAVLALTTNIAAKRGDTVEFDPAWFDIKSDATPEAWDAANPVR